MKIRFENLHGLTVSRGPKMNATVTEQIVNTTVNFQVFDRKRTRNENEEEREKRKRWVLIQCYLLLGVMIVQVIVTSYYFKMNGFTDRTKIKPLWIRPPQDIDVLAVLDFEIPCFGEDVDVLRRPALNTNLLLNSKWLV